MRISGGGDPRVPLAETLPGKLPQIKIAREAAAGYASYGNQIGLAVGQVAEFYHPGFTAKRLELGAVIGAVPAEQVRREKILRGDVVLLIGGKTGRDGIGGATGSSKVHTGESVESAGAEVQKGNAVEERKLQRLFRRKEVSLLIKRCNDFGAGGVAVAVGELAPGLDIDLDAVPKKYAGLDGTELAISESQERMAVVTSPEDAPSLIRSAAEENLDAVVIARVSAGDDTGETGGGGARLRMTWRGQTIVDLSRRFLDSNGPPRYADALIILNGETPGPLPGGSSGDHSEETKKDPRGYAAALEEELGSLRSGSRRGLQERFDGSIGASSVLFPWGGRTQGTPECGMAALLPALGKNCLSAALMSFGFDPALTAENPYEGAKGAVKEALAKFACLGGDPFKARLSLQEYFERMETPQSWGKPAAALLGALEAQLALGVPAIGGKDSMSGSYRDPANGVELTVPPSVAVFAAGIAGAGAIRSGALSGEAGNPIVLLYPGPEGADGGWGIFRANMACIAALTKRGVVKSAYAAAAGGAAAALALMAFGNMTGVEVRAAALDLVDEKNYPGAVLLELDRRDAADSEGGLRGEIREILQSSRWAQAGRTIEEPVFRVISRPASAGQGASAYTSAAECPLEELRAVYEGVLLRTYPQRTDEEAGAAAVKDLPAGSGGGGSAGPGAKFRPGGKSARPLVLLPVFPGTNGEGDMEKAFAEAGAKTRQFVFRNRTMEDVSGSIGELAAAIKEAQIIALSGGFSAGDEPDGSGKFIANVFRSPRLAEALMEFLEKRRGLMLGICNGFQALIKLGLVPYGRFIDPGENSPTLTVNRIGRHVSRMVRTRVMSTVSPWLALEEPGTVHILPVSHGEGRLVIDRAEGLKLFEDGQVPFCYADERGEPALTEPDNPNGSDFAIEALTSPGGRILGKMGHSERRGDFVHINIPGNKVQRIFEAGTAYFR
jgi:phosphoribosylformylglycinamidine synthase